MMLIIAYLLGFANGLGMVRVLIIIGMLFQFLRVMFGLRAYYTLPPLPCLLGCVLLAFAWRDVVSQPSDSEIGQVMVIPIAIVGIVMYYTLILLGMIIVRMGLWLITKLIGDASPV